MAQERGLGTGISRMGRRPGKNTGAAAPTGTGIVGRLTAAQETPPPPVGESTPRRVALDQLAPHPANPRADVGDVTDLAASVTAQGVLQAITIAPAGPYLTRHPEHTDAIAGRAWLVLFGHRRRAAALAAGLTDAPVVIRDDLDDDAAVLLAQLVENVQRADLTPLEEAAAYSALRESGLSGKDIATRVGVSTGQVSKRLSLLTLPVEARSALAGGHITTAEALHLLTLPRDLLELAIQDWVRSEDTPLTVVVARWQGRAEKIANRRQHAADLDARGIPVADNPAKVLGPDWLAHQVHNDTDIEAAAAAGDLVAVIHDRAVRPVEYYRRTPPLPGTGPGTDADSGPRISGENPETTLRISAGNPVASRDQVPAATPPATRRAAPTAAEAAEKAAAQERAEANHQRWQAAGRLATGELRPTLAAEILTDLLLGDTGPDDVAECAGFARVMIGQPAPFGDAWLAECAAHGGTTARRTAVAMALVHLGNRFAAAMKAEHPQLDPVLARYLTRLRDHGGYEPTAVETTVLAAALTGEVPGESTAAPDGPGVPAGNPAQDDGDDQ